MRAGLLRHFVTVERKNRTGEGTRGEVLETWEPLYSNVPASVQTTGGFEQEQTHQQKAQNTIKITMRYHDLGVQDRIVWNGRTFGIDSINNVDQRNRELHLTCYEGVK